MSTAGKLCISVIEARNLVADTVVEPSFYVRLKLAGSEVRTDVVKNCLSPKFLKDIRMGVPSPETDVLRIELLQVGPKGDLVVGSDELRVLSITGKGTIVHWFELKTFSQEPSAELCLVLRYLSAGANRPMSPSYAIAARQAKERALELQPPDLSSLQQGPPASVFSDVKAVATAAPALIQLEPPSTPHYPAAASAAPPSPSPSTGQQAPATPPRSISTSKKKHSSNQSQLPLPLAIACGVLVGAITFIIKRSRPAFYEVHDGEAICTVGACFNKDYKLLYRKNTEAFKNHT